METIVVIGGAGGIGSAIIERYIEVSNKEQLKIIVGDIDDENARDVVSLDDETIDYYKVNTKNLSEIVDFRTKVESNYACVDHLISLAGFALEDEFSGLEGTDHSVINKSVNLNLRSHIHIIKEFKGLLKKSQREDKNVVLVSSINAMQDYGLPAYSSSKAGLIGLTNSTLGELGDEKIRVNTVVPGTVTSQRSSDEPKDKQKLRKESPISRLCTPSEVGKAVHCLTHIMTAVNGEQIVVDCGQTKSGADYID